MSAQNIKSARERYIRVAAIDIVISDGIRNICIAGRHKYLENYVCKQTTTYKIKRD